MTIDPKLDANGAILFSEIEGAELTSVQFVMDYLILGFRGRGALTTLVWPEVVQHRRPLVFGMSDYRDALCALLTSVVEKTQITEDETIVITFHSGVHLRIALRNAKHAGERAIFTTPAHELMVW